MQVTYTAIFTQHTEKQTKNIIQHKSKETSQHFVHYPAGVVSPVSSGIISEYKDKQTVIHSEKNSENNKMHYYSVNIPDLGITVERIPVLDFNQIGLQKAINIAEYQIYLKIRQIEYDIRVYNLHHKHKKEISLPFHHTVWKNLTKKDMQLPIMVDTENFSGQKRQFDHCIKFRIDGKPFGKERPRKGYNSIYTPAKTHRYEKRIRHLALQSLQDKYGVTSIGSAFCSVNVKICYDFPTSFSKQKRVACKLGMIVPDKTPDADNVLKIVMDGLNPEKRSGRITENGIYLDDKQVISTTTEKCWKDAGYVEVTLQW